MKKDYLWDKTGKDPEIEKLENALKTFRQKDPTPPALPAKTLAFNKGGDQVRPRYFQFAFASFASLALIVISFGIFQAFQNDDPNIVQKDSERKSVELNTETSPISVSSENAAEESVEKEKSIKPEITKTVFTPRKNIKPKKKFRKTINKKAITPKKVKRETAERKVEYSELTAEEKYAYDQLMKALAITSSNLKIVKDKVNGLEKPTVRKSLR